jgi:hypothetical protein
MKLFIAFLGGFGLTLVSFGGGIMLAIAYFSAEPVSKPGPSVDTAAMWPSEPVKVGSDDGLQRLPDRPSATDDSRQIEVAAGAEDSSVGEDGVLVEDATDEAVMEVDEMTTAAVERDEPTDDPHRVTIMDAHVDWCSNRYRSYRAEDNSYQPYGRRGRQPCISPFFSNEGGSDDQGGEYAVDEYPANDEPQFIAEVGDEGSGPVMTRDHIQACFDRYNSYRPEDNSYQPYGGGPRQQCE